jgi:hypothetical protein
MVMGNKVEAQKTAIVVVALVSSGIIAFFNPDARLVFVNMCSTAIGGYLGATIPGGGGKNDIRGLL